MNHLDKGNPGWDNDKTCEFFKYMTERKETVDRILGSRTKITTERTILNVTVPWTEFDPPLSVEDKMELLDGAITKREYLVLRAIYLTFYTKLAKYQKNWKGSRSFYKICYLLAHAEMVNVDGRLEITDFGTEYMLSGRGFSDDSRT